MRDQQHSPGERRGALRAGRRLATLAILVLVLTVGCANQTAEPSGPTPGNTMPVNPSAQATPNPTGDTDLTIVINNGSSSTVTWRLTCNPPGGTHPDPKAACRALEDQWRSRAAAGAGGQGVYADLRRPRDGQHHGHLAGPAGHEQICS